MKHNGAERKFSLQVLPWKHNRAFYTKEGSLLQFCDSTYHFLLSKNLLLAFALQEGYLFVFANFYKKIAYLKSSLTGTYIK